MIESFLVLSVTFLQLLKDIRLSFGQLFIYVAIQNACLDLAIFLLFWLWFSIFLRLDRVAGTLLFLDFIFYSGLFWFLVAILDFS